MHIYTVFNFLPRIKRQYYSRKNSITKTVERMICAFKRDVVVSLLKVPNSPYSCVKVVKPLDISVGKIRTSGLLIGEPCSSRSANSWIKATRFVCKLRDSPLCAAPRHGVGHRIDGWFSCQKAALAMVSEVAV